MPYRLSILASAICCVLSVSQSYAVGNQANMNEEGNNEVNRSDKSQSTVSKMTPIVVYASTVSEVGQSIYNQEQLQRVPNTQKTMTDFLKVNPNVQFGNGSLASGRQGELDASDISINGALFYDNKFLLNNVNIGNSLNPASGLIDNTVDGLAGSSLNANINMDLICELEVLDSNVSAEYGEFTGGVVKAKTCAPKTEIGQIHGKINYDFTSSDWTKFNYISPEEQEKFEQGSDIDYQKDFVKQGLSTQLYGRASEKLGLSLAASRRWSDIEKKSDFDASENYDQKRIADDFSANAYYDLNENQQLKLGLYYQNSQGEKYVSSLKDGGYQTNIENLALDMELKSTFDHAVVTQNIVLQKQSNRKDSDSNESVAWNTSPDKNWNAKISSEGGYGALEMAQDNWEYNLKSVFDEITFANVHHQWTIGAGYSHINAKWDRPENMYQYFIPSKNNGLGTDTCTLIDGSVDTHCDLSYVGNDGTKGQYNTIRNVYQAGTVDVQQDKGYAFVEDQMNLNDQLKLRLGLRLDYDSISKNNNIAPRSQLQYFPFANERLGFTTGWNRYYANNALFTELQDGVNLLRIQEKRKNLNAEWLQNTSASAGTAVNRSELDTPFADEAVFAIHSLWNGWAIQLKYVNRDNQDQIRRQRISLSPIVDIYDNSGASKAETYTLSLANQTPIQFLGAKHSFNFAADYSDIQRNFNSYDDNIFIDQTYQQYILYDGEVIDEATRPATNFARPWTVRVGWNTEFTSVPLKISQFFRYRSDYDAMVSSTIPVTERPIASNGEVVKTRYDKESLGSAFNWDVRASYDFKVGRDDQLTLGLTINNLTNKHNKYTQNQDSMKSNLGSNGVYSESGRQFVADISYKF